MRGGGNHGNGNHSNQGGQGKGVGNAGMGGYYEGMPMMTPAMQQAMAAQYYAPYYQHMMQQGGGTWGGMMPGYSPGTAPMGLMGSYGAPGAYPAASRGPGGGGGAPRSGGPLTCKFCKQPGHHTAQCPRKPEHTVVCHACGAIGHRAPECPQVKARNHAHSSRGSGGLSAPEVCHRCAQPGHRAPQCPYKDYVVCHKCGQSGHKAPDCPHKTAAVVCHICSQPGHKAPDCPQKNLRPVVCHRCLQPGHKAPECTNKRAAPQVHAPSRPGQKAPHPNARLLTAALQLIATNGGVAPEALASMKDHSLEPAEELPVHDKDEEEEEDVGLKGKEGEEEEEEEPVEASGQPMGEDESIPVVPPLDTPEAVEAWRAARKSRFPVSGNGAESPDALTTKRAREDVTEAPAKRSKAPAAPPTQESLAAALYSADVEREQEYMGQIIEHLVEDASAPASD